MTIIVLIVSWSLKMKFALPERDPKLRILMLSLIIGAGFIAVISLDIYAELPSLFVSATLLHEALFLPLLSLVFCFLSLVAVGVARKSSKAVDSSKQDLKSPLAKEIALQISNDLRSPFSALLVAHHNSANLHPEVRELLNGASQRIKDITNQLAQY
jgi:hypothetical protein